LKKSKAFGCSQLIEFCLGFFILQDQNFEIDVQNMQGMRCVMCRNNFSLVEPSQNVQNTIRFKKGLLQYNPTHGSTSMKSPLVE